MSLLGLSKQPCIEHRSRHRRNHRPPAHASARSAGLAFQIVDDVLDMTQSSADLGKTAGKDTATTKATWPAVFGIDRSLHDARRAHRRRLRRHSNPSAKQQYR